MSKKNYPFLVAIYKSCIQILIKLKGPQSTNNSRGNLFIVHLEFNLQLLITVQFKYSELSNFMQKETAHWKKCTFSGQNSEIKMRLNMIAKAVSLLQSIHIAKEIIWNLNQRNRHKTNKTVILNFMRGSLFSFLNYQTTDHDPLKNRIIESRCNCCASHPPSSSTRPHTYPPCPVIASSTLVFCTRQGRSMDYSLSGAKRVEDALAYASSA